MQVRLPTAIPHPDFPVTLAFSHHVGDRPRDGDNEGYQHPRLCSTREFSLPRGNPSTRRFDGLYRVGAVHHNGRRPFNGQRRQHRDCSKKQSKLVAPVLPLITSFSRLVVRGCSAFVIRRDSSWLGSATATRVRR